MDEQYAAIVELVNRWLADEQTIRQHYKMNEKEEGAQFVLAYLEELKQIIPSFGQEENRFTGEVTDALLPLNGQERFDFVEEKCKSHYAFIQLNEMMDEVKKKALRLTIQAKRLQQKK